MGESVQGSCEFGDDARTLPVGPLASGGEGRDVALGDRPLQVLADIKHLHEELRGW